MILKGKSSDIAMRVVAGACGGGCAPPPLSDGPTLLDVEMRPGEEVQVPVDCQEGVLVYVLEGVALFGTIPLLSPKNSSIRVYVCVSWHTCRDGFVFTP